MGAVAVPVLWLVACLFAFAAGNCWGQWRRAPFLVGLALSVSAGCLAVALQVAGGMP